MSRGTQYHSCRFPELWLAIVVMVFGASGIFAQEICDNGIDDDSDSLVDINDPDCVCDGSQFEVLATDFEDMTCCPMDFTSTVEPGIGCLVGWSQAGNGTTDYHHTCGYTGGVLIPFLPMPPPSGQGAVGFITRDGYQEYVGTCMPMPMIAGETYTVEMYVGFNAGPFPPFSYESNSPFEIGVFGTTSCDNYPANISSCISNISSWSVIGTQVVTGTFGDWTFTSFTITPSENYAAIAIGGSCNASAQDSQYHFIDDVMITGNFMGGGTVPPDIDMSGDCITGVDLSVDNVPGATYQWYLDGVAINGATSNTYTVPSSANGRYNVVIDNGNGCVTSNDLEVNIETNVLGVSGVVNQVSCVGDTDGAIDLNLPTTNEPITVLWQTGETSGNLTGLAAGSYSVTITDANGCTGEETFEVTEPADPLTGLINNVTHPLAPATDGSAQVGAMGGLPDYTYLWDNGETTPLATTLQPGTHAVTITDQNGCEEILEVVINPPFGVSLNIENDICFNTCTGSAELFVTGGMPSYNYTWSSGGFDIVDFNLCAGVHSVTVTDNSGTLIVQEFEITTPDPILITGEVSPVACAGQTGMIEVLATGGTPGYTYNWSSGATTSTITDLEPGNYTLTVTDSAGCTSEEFYLISAVDPIEITAEITDASCDGGSDGVIDITITNGMPPYSYAWSHGYTGEDPTDLGMGMYSVTVVDAQGCMQSEAFTISEESELDAVLTSLPASCPGVGDGMAEVMVNGGTPPYQYNWSNGSTTVSINGVPPGMYTVTITDNSNCALVHMITIDAGPGVEIGLAAIDVQCHGMANGAIDLSVTEGTTPFQFAWSSGQTTEDTDSLPPGTYMITVTDQNGCSTVDMVDIGEPPDLMVGAVIQSVSCEGLADGSVALTLSGGTSPYALEWSTGDTGTQLDSLDADEYTVTITDDLGCRLDTAFTVRASTELVLFSEITAPGCNGGTDGTIDLNVTGGFPPYDFIWSTGATTEDLQDLAAGMYTVVVTDSRGCTASTDIIVSSSGSMSVTGSISGISCNGERDAAIDLTVNGGMPPYIFSWSNGDTSEDLENIGFGKYMVTITDAGGCMVIGMYEIGDILPLVITSNTEEASCFDGQDGAAQITTEGGTGPYNYLWSNGLMMQDLINAAAGQYVVTVTDANGCSIENMIEIKSPPALSLDVDIQQISCIGMLDGSLLAEVTGGTLPYTYTWENGSNAMARTELSPGNYSLTVTDFNGCTVSATYPIDTIEQLSLTVSHTDIDCHRTSGTIIIAGSNPEQYKILLNGEDIGVSTDTVIAGLEGGTYTLAYAVDSDCHIPVDTLDVITASDYGAQILPVDTEVVAGSQVVLEALINGIIGQYTLAWSTTAEMTCLEFDSLGHCRVIRLSPEQDQAVVLQVVDERQCQVTTEAFIRVRVNKEIYVPNVFSPNGDGVNDVFRPIASDPAARLKAFNIYDRWGGLVHQESDLTLAALNGWDGYVQGHVLHAGVFVYFMEVEYADGTTDIVSGDVTLIR